MPADKFSHRVIKVAGERVEFDATSGFPIGDLDLDMEQIASLMAWWGSVQASAERERIEVDTQYRKWRGEMALASKQSSEWRVKAEIESDANFVVFKNAIAKAEQNAILAKNCFLALDKKANMLQSRGAREREERAAHGMTTPERPKAKAGKRAQ